MRSDFAATTLACMGFWFRLRLGPFGYTARGRRKPQNYRAYKASRERREKHAERYKAERAIKQGATATATSEVTPLAPSTSRLRGITDAEFDGVTLPTLRAWLKFWKDEGKSSRRAEEMARDEPGKFGGRTRADHIRMIEAEIEARS